MDPTMAKIVLYVITGIGILVWLAALMFFNAASQAHVAAGAATAERFELSEPPSRNRIYGTAEVEGEPGTLAAKAAAVLAKEGPTTVGNLKILKQTDDRVVFEGCGPDSPAGQTGPLVSHGQLQFSSVRGGRTRIDYGLQLAGGRGLLIAGVLVLILGAVALVIGFLLINTLVVSHPHAAVRAQAVQMCQVVHFLWPPFLFGGLYRRRYSVVRGRFDALIHNLPYCDT